MAEVVTNDNYFEQSCGAAGDIFAGRSFLSPRINNDERAMDGSSCRGAGARAESE
jgi:hypothetical protein